ncbi:MAG: hypothetical protein AAF799_24030 [Myxococcota bacterium]
MVALLGACGPTTGEAGGGGSTGSDASEVSTGITPMPTGSMTTDALETSSGATTASTGSDPDSSSGDVFPEECSIWLQDCPEGFKCQPFWEESGADLSTECFPIVEGGSERGEPCSYRGEVAMSPDTCDADTVCWYLDVDTGTGTCMEFCRGTEQEWTCSGGCDTCRIAADGPLSFCLEHCDPLAPQCPDGQGCITSLGSFQCVPGTDLPPDPGQGPGATCGFGDSCAEGLVCFGDGLGVCAVPCDPGAADTCDEQDPGTTCMAFELSRGTPKQCGNDNLGFCL